MKRILKKFFDRSDATRLIGRVLRENASDYRNNYLLATFCLVIVALTTAFTAYIVRDLINEIFDKKILSQAFWLAGVVLVIYLIKGAASYFQDVILNRIGNNIVARYQRRLFDQMMQLGVGYFHKTRSTYLIGQINQNITGIRDLLNTLITVLIKDLLAAIALVGVMIYMDPIMSLFALLIGPPAILTVAGFRRRVKAITRQEVDLNSRVMSAMQETAQGISIVKAFTMEEQLAAKIHALTAEAEERANKIARIMARTRPLMETLGGFAIAGVIAFGGYRVINGSMDPGSMFAFITAMMLAYEPAKRLARLQVELERSLVNARMIYEVLDTPTRQSDLPNAKPFKFKQGDVQLSGVNFSYADASDVERPSILNDVSFAAKAGQTTALVGPSGGGKSTIMALLQRFHDLDSGAIKVDDQDIAEVTIKSLRQKIAYVSQQPVMFEGTIAENLRYAKPDASESDIVSAAKQAQAHEFITDFPDGYDTPVGENGATLSGGQRQRISIARALLRDAPILLLDEATSALDNESESKVQAALDELMKGRTTLVVAHRLSTIIGADNIIVIENGRVVDQGTHADLIQRTQGVYARYHDLQIDNETAK